MVPKAKMILLILGGLIIIIFILFVLLWKDVYKDMISFFGSLLGGYITLWGVLLTLEYQNNQNRREEELKYKPILDVEEVNVDDRLLPTCKYREFTITYPNYDIGEGILLDGQTVETNLLFKNSGRGETHKTIIEDIRVKNVSWDENAHLCPDYSGPLYIGEITSGSHFKIKINLPTRLFMPILSDGSESYSMAITVNITYSDMFDRMKYRLDLHLLFGVSVSRFVEELPEYYKDGDKEGLKFAEVEYRYKEVGPSKLIYSNKARDYIHEASYFRDH